MCVYIYIYRPPQWLSSKETACNAEGAVSIPGLGRSPGEGHGYPLQYSCLGNLMDRGTWWATVDRVAESDTTEAAERERESYLQTNQLWYKYTSLKMGIHTMCMCAKSLQSCLTLCDPMDRSPPGFSVHGISQAGILEWVAISSSRALPEPGIEPHLWHLLHWQLSSLPLAPPGKPVHKAPSASYSFGCAFLQGLHCAPCLTSSWL